MKIKLATLSIALFISGGVLAEDTIAKVKASGVVTMGVRESSGALSYALPGGKYTGYQVEICNRVIANLEKAVGRKLEVRYRQVDSQNRLTYIQNGTVDLECGSTTNNKTRQQDVAFLPTTFVEEVRIAVRADSGITSIVQLNGKSVGTTTGSTSVQTLAGNERVKGMKFREVFGKDHTDTFQMLEAGRVEAFVMDRAILASSIATARKPSDFQIVGEVLSVEPIAIMIRKDDPAFKKLGDDTLKDMMKSGEIAKLWDKWFMQPIPPKNIRVGYAANDNTKAAWANPNDKPMESYPKK